MFCPNCGSEDRQSSQYCRACGTDMRGVRQGLEKPESVMATVVSAREEIGRAIAARIRQVRDAGDLKLLEELLPEVEKFFETPEQRRLRRIRAGVVTAMCGLGGVLFFHLLSLKDPDAFFLVTLGVTTFLIGLGIVLNGLLFTVPKEHKEQRYLNEAREEIDRVLNGTDARRELSGTKEMGIPVSSVTEHTTRSLPQEEAARPQGRL